MNAASVPDRDVLKRECCSRSFIKELSNELGEAVFPLFCLLHFGLRKSYVPREGGGVRDPVMGETSILLDTLIASALEQERALEGTSKVRCVKVVSHWSEDDLGC